MTVSGVEGLSDEEPIGTLSFERDGERVSQTFTASSFVSEIRTGDAAIMAQTLATELRFTPGEAGEGVLRYESTGAAETLLDAVIFLQ